MFDIEKWEALEEKSRELQEKEDLLRYGYILLISRSRFFSLVGLIFGPLGLIPRVLRILYRLVYAQVVLFLAVIHPKLALKFLGPPKGYTKREETK